jgi:hypothetical protein
MEACKQALADAIAEALTKGVRKANIEIELIHFIKRELYRED